MALIHPEQLDDETRQSIAEYQAEPLQMPSNFFVKTFNLKVGY